jgi:hypothetical protein
MYRVAWRQFALDELARIWLLADSAQRNAITQAAHRIDQRLEMRPHDEGESRSPGLHFLFELPLGISYEILEDQKRVRVLHVWHIRPRSK